MWVGWRWPRGLQLPFFLQQRAPGNPGRSSSACLIEQLHGGLDPGPPGWLFDAEVAADFAAIQMRVGGPARGRWIVFRGDGRYGSSRTRHRCLNLVDCAGEIVPANRRRAAKVVGAPCNLAIGNGHGDPYDGCSDVGSGGGAAELVLHDTDLPAGRSESQHGLDEVDAGGAEHPACAQDDVALQPL